MKRSVDLLFFNVFVLLNGMFTLVPGVVSLMGQRVLEHVRCTASVVRLQGAQIAGKLDLTHRLTLTEPHAAP